MVVDGVPTDIDGPAAYGYLWLGLVGGLLTYTLWFSGIRRLPVTATALLGLLSPLMAALLGATMAVAVYSSGILEGDVIPSLTLAPLLLAACVYLLVTRRAAPPA